MTGFARMVSALALVSSLAGPASAATSCVNPGGTDGCFASIAAAVAAAPSGGTIEVAAGAYDEPGVEPGKKALTVRGAGVAATTWSSTAVPLLQVQGRLTVSDIRITGPLVVNEAPRVRLIDVALVASAVSSSPGVSASDSRLELDRTTVQGFGGGLVLLRSTVDVVASTISGNGSAGSGAGGGGIYNWGSRLRVRRSTISGNRASVGGGIYAPSYSRRTVLLVEQSTITANAADDVGGGIAIVRNSGQSPRVTLTGSIVGENSAGNGDADCSASDLSSGLPVDAIRVTRTSLVQDAGSCTFVVARSSTLEHGSPSLGPLQNNGGPTETHAPLPGSPVLGLLTKPTACKGTDQRGVARTTPCDLGSVEVP